MWTEARSSCVECREYKLVRARLSFAGDQVLSSDYRLRLFRFAKQSWVAERSLSSPRCTQKRGERFQQVPFGMRLTPAAGWRCCKICYVAIVRTPLHSPSANLLAVLRHAGRFGRLEATRDLQ